MFSCWIVSSDDIIVISSDIITSNDSNTNISNNQW